MPISAAILKSIENNDPKLVTLDLSSQDPALDSDDIEELVKAIEKGGNTTLVTLILNDNLIDDKGATSLSRLTAVKTLQLANNEITDEGAIALANGATNLASLELSANKIGDRGFKALLEKQQNLRFLMIGHNKISNNTALDVLRDGRLNKLNAIYLGENSIEESTLEAVKRYIERDRKAEEKTTDKPEKQNLSLDKEIESLLKSAEPLVELLMLSKNEQRTESKESNSGVNKLIICGLIAVTGMVIAGSLSKKNKLDALLKQLPSDKQQQYEQGVRDLISSHSSSATSSFPLLPSFSSALAAKEASGKAVANQTPPTSATNSAAVKRLGS